MNKEATVTEFKQEDVVGWQSNGLKKVGQVAVMVPAGALAGNFIGDLKGKASIEFNPQGVRKEDSYLILVDRGEGKKPGLYWPLTSLLKKTSAHAKNGH